MTVEQQYKLRLKVIFDTLYSSCAIVSNNYRPNNWILMSTFILCDRALSKSLFRAASIELVAGEGVTLLLMSAPEAVSVEDTALASVPVTVD